MFRNILILAMLFQLSAGVSFAQSIPTNSGNAGVSAPAASTMDSEVPIPAPTVIENPTTQAAPAISAAGNGCTAFQPFTQEQLDCLVELCKKIERRPKGVLRVTHDNNDYTVVGGGRTYLLSLDKRAMFLTQADNPEEWTKGTPQICGVDYELFSFEFALLARERIRLTAELREKLGIKWLDPVELIAEIERRRERPNYPYQSDLPRPYIIPNFPRSLPPPVFIQRCPPTHFPTSPPTRCGR